MPITATIDPHQRDGWSLVDEIRVVGRAKIYPSFSFPAVRPPSGSVPRAGFEPAAYSLGGTICQVPIWLEISDSA
jgi:hypothetical protein